MGQSENEFEETLNKILEISRGFGESTPDPRKFSQDQLGTLENFQFLVSNPFLNVNIATANQSLQEFVDQMIRPMRRRDTMQTVLAERVNYHPYTAIVRSMAPDLGLDLLSILYSKITPMDHRVLCLVPSLLQSVGVCSLIHATIQRAATEGNPVPALLFGFTAIAAEAAISLERGEVAYNVVVEGLSDIIQAVEDEKCVECSPNVMARALESVSRWAVSDSTLTVPGIAHLSTFLATLSKLNRINVQLSDHGTSGDGEFRDDYVVAQRIIALRKEKGLKTWRKTVEVDWNIAQRLVSSLRSLAKEMQWCFTVRALFQDEVDALKSYERLLWDNVEYDHRGAHSVTRCHVNSSGKREGLEPLPVDSLMEIFAKLSLPDISHVAQTCRRFAAIVGSGFFWLKFCEVTHPLMFEGYEHTETKQYFPRNYFRSRVRSARIAWRKKPSLPCPRDFCRKSFARASQLQSHLRDHFEEIRLSHGRETCDVVSVPCSFRTHKPAAVKRHMEEHLDGSFRCRVCFDVVHGYDNYIRHSDQHAKYKYQCPKCHILRSKICDLVEHFAAMHANYPTIPCLHKGCAEMFKYRFQRQNHWKTCHDGIDPRQTGKRKDPKDDKSEGKKCDLSAESKQGDEEEAPTPKRQRRARCMACLGCTSVNCGECRHCKDMREFGGPSRLRKACKLRVCRRPVSHG